MIRTPICDLLGIEYPILQGGMAWAGTAELAAAVSNAGGLGIIGAGNAPPDWLRDQIRAVRERTNKPFGVNVMLLSPFAQECVDVVYEEMVPVVVTGAGNPGPLVPRFKGRGQKVVPVVASVALARRLERYGIDAVVAEGTESGGHVGETTTLVLVPQVVDAVKVPVIAAGGIADGRAVVAALALGAQGVQMGTRFLCSEECIAHQNFKTKVLQSKDRATVVSGQTLGHPVRALENKMTRRFLEMEKAGRPASDLEEFGAGKLRLAVVDGDMEMGSLMAGQCCGLINDIKPVAVIIADLLSETEALIGRLSTLPRESAHA